MTPYEYIDAAAMHRWQYGQQDCTLFVGNYVRDCFGVDPGLGIRGSYSNEAGALAIITRAGGMLAFIGARMASVGWYRVEKPADGDVAVCVAPLAPLGVVGEVPAIRAGGLWHVRTLHGVCARDFPAVMVWRQPVLIRMFSEQKASS